MEILREMVAITGDAAKQSVEETEVFGVKKRTDENESRHRNLLYTRPLREQASCSD